MTSPLSTDPVLADPTLAPELEVGVETESKKTAAPGGESEPTTDSGPSGSSSALGSRLRSAVGVVLPPVIGVAAFLLLWTLLAPQVQTSLGELPGPDDVWAAGGQLWDEYQAAQQIERDFYANQDARNAELVAAGTPELQQNFTHTGIVTFPSQIWTSLKTVATGFLIGVLFAIPTGLLSGLSKTFGRAIAPLVEIFKPVSPLAWLPIVTLVVAATVTSNDGLFPKSFIVSALVVTLNSLWPTLINTKVGASSVDPDLLNVAKVLRLGWFTKLRKIILPSALPYIFTGMRLSLGVGWMVLIAAEMLAQNPGLGKFVWDEFQNNSSQSLARIMFAVLVIGVIGFLLDRLMGLAESLVSRNRGV